MVSLKTLKTTPERSTHPGSSSNSNFSPRLSFSTELLVGKINSISLSPNPKNEEKDYSTGSEPERTRSTEEFEFLSGGLTNMIAADEVFREGKLLPFWQMQRSDHYKLNRTSLKSENPEKGFEKSSEQVDEEAGRIRWLLDDDPSPRPPTCTVLWKELLRLRKQRASSLSPSSSSSSSSSSRSSKKETSSADHGGKEMGENKEKVVVKRIKKVVERTRSVSSIRIRPVFTLAVCTQRKNNVSPYFYSRKGNTGSDCRY